MSTYNFFGQYLRKFTGTNLSVKSRGNVQVSVEIKHSRGDVHLGNQQNLKDGQIFLSYVNTDSVTSGGHSYSEGQLWAKDPSSDQLTEIANARSINSLTFKGYIDSSFKGDFINADEENQAAFKHCHVGDFWIFQEDNLEDFEAPFYKKDILLVTAVSYREELDGPFRETLQNVQYIRIAVSNEENIRRLNARLCYKGEFGSLKEFYKLPKEKGNLFIATSPLPILKVNFVEGSLRESTDDFVRLKTGDFIWYNGQKWEVIPSGQDASTVLYSPDQEAIDSVATFEDWQKDLLKSPKNVKEALDILTRTKAQLDENGKVPYNQLPEALRHSLSVQGKFYPIKKTSESPNDPSNQNPWPTLEDGSKMLSGFYWIVDCFSQVNVQYQDPDNPGRVVELNTGDWVVWIEQTHQFEVIDNSDRVTSIDVIDPVTFEKTSLLGNVGFIGKGVDVKVSGNNVEIGAGRLVTQDEALGDSAAGYFPVYSSNQNKLTVSQMYQTLTEIVTQINFQVGQLENAKNLSTFGNIGIRKTPGNTTTTYVNNFLYFDTASLLKDDATVFYRTTQLKASERRNLATGNETISVSLPEASSLLVGVMTGDSITTNYITKTDFSGFLTDTLTSEVVYKKGEERPKEFEENFGDGYENIGIGRTVVEDTDLGEITFYAKSKDDYNGFFKTLHFDANRDSKLALLYEHFLNRLTNAKTHLVINPTVLEDDIETFVKMPMVSGMLITWEEVSLMFGFGNGTPLMIPAWEEMQFRNGRFVGLDSSPIWIKINRKAHDNVQIDRINDLSKDYGEGKESAWGYINSSQEGSLIDEQRGSVDDFVTFDAWFESQRAVVTHEAFIIPAAAIDDGDSELTMEMDYTNDPEKEVKLQGAERKFQRILPSRTLYPDEAVYYDPITGKLIPQNVTSKDVEMPAVGGVLLTSRSRIECGFWN